jgi:hypothetical protein
MAFVTVLFTLSSLSDLGLKFAQIYWLLYLVPPVALCYDSYIMAADTRVKRIGAFLGRHPKSVAGEVERQWEIFSAIYRSPFAPYTDVFLSLLATLGAAFYLNTQQNPGQSGRLELIFALWLVASLAVIIWLWINHLDLISRIDQYADNEMECRERI